MKKIYFILYIVIGLLITVNANAQTNVTSSGMSIQGIARDETNAAIANIDQLPLIFTVYYLGTGNSEQVILTKTANVRTDNFGVFSYVLDINQGQYALISSQSAYLKVVQQSIVFSNEKLQAVPYAIFAQNGVPTGSIMPFIGTTAPNGWLLCDGNGFTDDVTTASLKALLGSTNTPNLSGMFLRGAGSTSSGHSGPTLKTVQQDDMKSHLHNVNLNTNTTGQHDHNTTFANDDYNNSGGPTPGTGLLKDAPFSSTTSHTLSTSTDGQHYHNVSGNTATTGGTETRPINYGVNYIIKI
ncbi:tail fiber protein [Flavobacterium sp. W20_MBD1_R3]|uniref:tail fiber protein n=1 Tax=Flavobacterium sp. W20_MBD1_R3 TaxID=3240278 RepID=UPI003F8EF951